MAHRVGDVEIEVDVERNLWWKQVESGFSSWHSVDRSIGLPFSGNVILIDDHEYCENEICVLSSGNENSSDPPSDLQHDRFIFMPTSKKWGVLKKMCLQHFVSAGWLFFMSHRSTIRAFPPCFLVHFDFTSSTNFVVEPLSVLVSYLCFQCFSHCIICFIALVFTLITY